MIELIPTGIWSIWEAVNTLTLVHVALGILLVVLLVVSLFGLAVLIGALSEASRLETESYARLHAGQEALIADQIRYNEVLRRRVETARMVADHETRMAHLAIDDFKRKRHARAAAA